MPDWIQLGLARGTPLHDLNQIAPVLNALEALFRPLVEQLPPATEPAFILSGATLEAE